MDDAIFTRLGEAVLTHGRAWEIEAWIGLAVERTPQTMPLGTELLKTLLPESPNAIQDDHWAHEKYNDSISNSFLLEPLAEETQFSSREATLSIVDLTPIRTYFDTHHIPCAAQTTLSSEYVL